MTFPVQTQRIICRGFLVAQDSALGSRLQTRGATACLLAHVPEAAVAGDMS